MTPRPRRAPWRHCARLGDGLDLDAVEAAWGVREIATAEMVKAVRARLSMHALSAPEHCLVATAAAARCSPPRWRAWPGLKRVYIPELASVLSAYGAATMDIRANGSAPCWRSCRAGPNGSTRLCRSARGGLGRPRRRRRARG
jgi:N-methylhydantoinase A/oxoprolinase/acetone carboxylase beta subunit